MLRILILITTIITSLSSTAQASYLTTIDHTPGTAIYTYSPKTNLDLGDLNHSYAYSWGIDLGSGIDFSKVSITEASIKFVNIFNNTGADYDLYVRLLDHDYYKINKSVREGVLVLPDYQASGDKLAFDKYGYTNGETLLHQYHDSEIPISSNTKTDVTLSITDVNVLKLLNDYAFTDGIIGLGFDPDCHFLNEGVFFSITVADKTSEVPEPATMLLFGTGLAGLAASRRKIKS